MSKRSVVLLVSAGGVVGALLLALAAPSAELSLSDRVQDLFGYGGKHEDNPDHGRDLFHSGADIGGAKEDLSYADYDSRRDRGAIDGFAGFGCPGTCARHEAGYRWAATHGVKKVAECIGLSWSEVEGCVAFVSEKESSRSSTSDTGSASSPDG